MTIESTIHRDDYTGNGSTNEYDFTFKTFSDTDLLVVVADTAGTETTLVLNTDYTVDGAGDDAGGSITLLDASQDWIDDDGFLETGYALVIKRVRPLLQETDIENQGPYYAHLHENAFDHFIMIAQQQQDQIDRSLRLPETEEGLTDLPGAAARANKFLAFDADSNPIASAGGISNSIPVTSFIETLLDDANAAAARTTLGISDAFNTGDKLIFPMPTVPSGWILDTSWNDKALRVVSGVGGGTGGTVGLSTSLAHTHTVAAHQHVVPITAVNHQHEETILNETATGTNMLARSTQFGVGTTDSSSTVDLPYTNVGAGAGRRRKLTSTIYSSTYPTGSTRNTETTAPLTDSKLGVLAYADVIVGIKN